MAEALAQSAPRERPILFAGRLVRAILAGQKTQTRRVVKEDRLTVRLPYTVKSDMPLLPGDPPQLRALPGAYHARINPHGAVSVVMEDGRLLGVKPGEFDFVCPYAAGTTRLVAGVWRIDSYYVPNRLWVRESAWIAPPGFSNDGTATDADGRRRTVSYDASADGDERRCAKDYGVKLTPSIHMPRWASRITLEVTGVRVQRLLDISEPDAVAEGIPLFNAQRTPGMATGYALPHWAHVHETAREAFFCAWNELHSEVASAAKNPWVWVIEFRRVDVR